MIVLKSVTILRHVKRTLWIVY